MSDVSKTNEELIEEARRSFKATNASASLIYRLANALEAATRVPVQGEPNVCLDHKPVQHRDGKPPWCNTCGRATVPDAATEGDECALPGHAGCKRVMVDGEPWVDHFPAERDAALAAIERIREAVSGHPECDRYSEDDVISCGWKSAYASVVAALDGAPEPEEKP